MDRLRSRLAQLLALAIGLVALTNAGAATPSCDAALKPLAELESAALDAARQARDGAAHRAALARLGAQRRLAAQRCLAVRDDAPPPRPGRLAEPPIGVPPITVPQVRVAPLRVPPTAVAPPALIVPAPATPPTATLCGATGCWLNDGRFVPRIGAGLVGPGGACRQQGTQVVCP